MSKRILLFFATNILIIAMISLIISALGLHSYLSSNGLDYRQLAIFCLLWGMAGAFISLLLSKWMAKMAMGVVIINPLTATREEHFLLDMIYALAQKAGLSTMPEVGIYSSPEINAFATGYSCNHALVAVSSSLLSNMNRDEIEAVLGHEISHVANGDMVTMTLVQGLINSFSLFLSRVLAYALTVAMSRGEEKNGDFSYITYTICTLVFDVLFTLLGSLLTAAYSRHREFRADAGGASLVGRDKMLAALTRLKNSPAIEDSRAPSLAAFKIAHHASWISLFSSHPPLDQRISRLKD